MDAAFGSAAPALRYFCSQAHYEEGKEDHELTMKEYNYELARKEGELEGKQEKHKADTGLGHSEDQAIDDQRKTADVVEDLKGCDQVNPGLDSNDQGSNIAVAAADPGPMETTEKQPERLKTTTSFDGTKEKLSGKIDSATAGASGIKQAGLSLDATHSKDATVLCSYPGCSLRGTNFCGSCKTTPYCSAECQHKDWPRHRKSCEGRSRKVSLVQFLDTALVLEQYACQLCLAAGNGQLAEVQKLLTLGADKDKA